MPRGPLADDWLFWDPETIFAYPHSSERELHADDACAAMGEPEQLDLFDADAREGAISP